MTSCNAKNVTKDLVVPLLSLLFAAAFSYDLSYAGKLCFFICFGWYLKVQLKSCEWGRDRSPHRSDYEVLFPLKARLSHPAAEPSGDLWTPAFSPVKAVVCPVLIVTQAASGWGDISSLGRLGSSPPSMSSGCLGLGVFCTAMGSSYDHLTFKNSQERLH